MKNQQISFINENFIKKIERILIQLLNLSVQIFSNKIYLKIII
jgi:hypothetical protein